MKELVQKLRDLTGAGVMECKKALEDAGGDIEKAKLLIEERGISKAERKSDRAVGAGLLYSYLHNERIGVLLELRCETDFVVKSDPMKELAHDLVMQIAAMDPDDVDALLAQPYIKDESRPVEAVVKAVIAKVGENIKIERFCRYAL